MLDRKSLLTTHMSIGKERIKSAYAGSNVVGILKRDGQLDLTTFPEPLRHSALDI